MRDLVFVHIPKTAGTSLRSALVAAFPDKHVLFDYGRAEQLTSDAIRNIRYSGRNEPWRLREATGSSPILLTGHFPARDYLNVFAHENFITFVREPISRVISDYKHFVRHFALDESLIKFASRPELRNRQTAFLSDPDIDSIGFVGIVEDYNNSLRRLAEFLGREVTSILSNQAPATQAIDIEDRELQILRELNAQDISLYQYILNMDFSKKLASLSKIRGSARRDGFSSIRGWAVCGDPNRIVRLSLEIDGTLVSRGGIVCDIYRPDLVISGESRTGLGGFEIDLSTYQTKSTSVFRLFSEDWSLTF
jgi:hypothetical protein